MSKFQCTSFISHLCYSYDGAGVNGIFKNIFPLFFWKTTIFLPFTPAPSYTADKDGLIIWVNSLDESRVGKCFKEKRVNSNTDNDPPSNIRINYY